MAREAKVIFRLDEDIKVKLQTLAEERGLTMSALCAYVIGNFIVENEYKLKIQEKLAMSLGPELVEFMKQTQE